MKVYVNAEERPLLQEVLQRALQQLDVDIQKTGINPEDWMTQRRLKGDRRLLQGLLAKLEEKEGAA